MWEILRPAPVGGRPARAAASETTACACKVHRGPDRSFGLLRMTRLRARNLFAVCEVRSSTRWRGYLAAQGMVRKGRRRVGFRRGLGVFGQVPPTRVRVPRVGTRVLRDSEEGGLWPSRVAY